MTLIRVSGLAVSITLILSGVSGTISSATVHKPVVSTADREVGSVSAISDSDHDRIAGLAKFFEEIEQIPESVLVQGDVATRDWLERNTPARATEASVTACAGAISALLGGNLVPVAKLIKIKKLVQELGGVKKAVQLMWGASFSYEKMQAVGGALAVLGAELLGITAVKKNCFE